MIIIPALSAHAMQSSAQLRMRKGCHTPSWGEVWHFCTLKKAVLKIVYSKVNQKKETISRYVKCGLRFMLPMHLCKLSNLEVLMTQWATLYGCTFMLKSDTAAAMAVFDGEIVTVGIRLLIYLLVRVELRKGMSKKGLLGIEVVIHFEVLKCLLAI